MHPQPSPSVAPGIPVIFNNQLQEEPKNRDEIEVIKTIDKIITAAVCNYFGKTLEEVILKSRKREYCQVRQWICYYLYLRSKLSLYKIGQIVGNRDHATVLHSYNTILHGIQFNKQIKSIEQKLTEIIKYMTDKSRIVPTIAGDAKIAIRAKYSENEIMDNEELEILYRDVCTLQAFGDNIKIKSKEMLTLLEKYL